jgi:hypothetical protein
MQGMKSERERTAAAGFEYIQDEINWTEGVGRPAGMYWLGGRIKMAAHGSDAEGHLRENGWVLIATLRFDRDPLESTVRGRSIERVASTDIADAFTISGMS